MTGVMLKQLIRKISIAKHMAFELIFEGGKMNKSLLVSDSTKYVNNVEKCIYRVYNDS